MVHRKPEHDPNQRFLYLHFEQSPFLCAQKPLPDFWCSRSDSSKGEAQSGAGCVGFGLRLAVLVGVHPCMCAKQVMGEAPCRGWTFACSFSSWQDFMIVVYCLWCNIDFAFRCFWTSIAFPNRFWRVCVDMKLFVAVLPTRSVTHYNPLIYAISSMKLRIPLPLLTNREAPRSCGPFPFDATLCAGLGHEAWCVFFVSA